MKKARNNEKRISRLFQWFDKLVYRVTGRAHQYHVEIWYKGHDGAQRLTSPYISGIVGLTFREGGEATHRAVRRYFGEKMIPQLPRRQLTNGKLVIHQISYLGRY